jgi:hypothetical protein
VQAAERLVGQQHAAARVEHDHTFAHRIECALHAIGNYRGRVEMLQCAPQVQAERHRTDRRHEQ